MQTRTLSRPILQSRRNSLKKYPPPSLSAGGIRTVEDARRMLDAGANGVLLQDELARMDIPQDFMEAILALRAD